MYSISRKFQKQPNSAMLRTEYLMLAKKYRKACKQAQRAFKQSFIDQLDSLHENNPQAYWAMVNKLKAGSSKNMTDNIPPDE